MKRFLLIFTLVFILIFFGAVFTFAYDFEVAGVSVAGAALGAYGGQLLSVPILILMSNAGIIEGDIFSPFSTAMFDAMDIGSAVGTVAGGIAAKYGFLALARGTWDLQDFLIDILSSSLIVTVSHIAFNMLGDYVDIPVFLENIVIVPVLTGTYLGIFIPAG